MESTKHELILELFDVHSERDEWFVSINTALDGITVDEAKWVGPGETNTIWQIVNHLSFWNEDVLHRLRGTVNPRSITSNDETFGSAGDDQDEAAWAGTLTRFKTIMSELRSEIERIDEARLDEPYRPESPTIRRLLGNILMHDSYHLGQIVMIRKIRKSWPGFDWS